MTRRVLVPARAPYLIPACVGWCDLVLVGLVKYYVRLAFVDCFWQHHQDNSLKWVESADANPFLGTDKLTCQYRSTDYIQ